MDEQIRYGFIKKEPRTTIDDHEGSEIIRISDFTDNRMGSNKQRIKQPKSCWATKEGLIVLSLILLCIFSLMTFIFETVWTTFAVAFRFLSGLMFFIYLIITIIGLKFFIKDRRDIWSHEREGLILFVIGGLVTVLLPILGATAGLSPDTYFNNNSIFLLTGIIPMVVGAVIIAWYGGFYSIWFFGILYFLVMSSHEAFMIAIYTHHFGPYDQYYGNLGLMFIVISTILFVYHELKYLYLGRLIKRATLLRKQGKYTQAFKPLNRALKIYPRYPTAWNNRGNLLSDLGRYKEAIKCYDKALAISPGFRVAEKNKAVVIDR